MRTIEDIEDDITNVKNELAWLEEDTDADYFATLHYQLDDLYDELEFTRDHY